MQDSHARTGKNVSISGRVHIFYAIPALLFAYWSPCLHIAVESPLDCSLVRVSGCPVRLRTWVRENSYDDGWKRTFDLSRVLRYPKAESMLHSPRRANLAKSTPRKCQLRHDWRRMRSKGVISSCWSYPRGRPVRENRDEPVTG